MDNPHKILDCGYVLLLTDAPLYWNKDGKGYAYQEFSLKEGTTITSGSKNWYKNPPLTSTQLKTMYGARSLAITIRNNYSIQWSDYIKPTKYLLLQI